MPETQRKRIVTAAGIVIAGTLLAWGVWYGANKFVARNMDLMEHIAIGDLEAVEYVVRWRPDCISETFPVKPKYKWHGPLLLYELGITPLQHAAESRQVEIARFLIKCGGDVNADRKFDVPPDMYIMRTDISEKVPPSRTRGMKGIRPLHAAAYNGDTEMVELLLDAGADINSTALEIMGMTPLLVAANFWREDCAILLIERDADINAETFTDGTPLAYATSRRQVLLTRKLLACGARPYPTFGQKGDRSSLLEWGIHEMSAMFPDICDQLETLLEAGVDPRAPSEREALNLAVGLGHPNAISLLLKYKAPVSPELMHIAVEGCRLEIVTLLLELGIKPTSTDKDGKTPLHRLGQNFSKEMAEVLIAAGADVNAIDKFGYSPWDRAPSQELRNLISAKGGKPKIYAHLFKKKEVASD